MKLTKLEFMKKGWVVGDFDLPFYRTKDVEVAVKHYKAGDKEDSHFHKIATEITIVVLGTIRMNKVEYTAGDIIMMEPGESTDFEAITDAINTVIKLPGALNDKYLDN